MNRLEPLAIRGIYKCGRCLLFFLASVLSFACGPSPGINPFTERFGLPALGASLPTQRQSERVAVIWLKAYALLGRSGLENRETFDRVLREADDALHAATIEESKQGPMVEATEWLHAGICWTLRAPRDEPSPAGMSEFLKECEGYCWRRWRIRDTIPSILFSYLEWLRHEEPDELKHFR